MFPSWLSTAHLSNKWLRSTVIGLWSPKLPRCDKIIHPVLTLLESYCIMIQPCGQRYEDTNNWNILFSFPAVITHHPSLLALSYQQSNKVRMQKRKRPTLLRFFTFESMAEDLLQDGNKVDELWRRVIYCLKTGAVKQSLHWKPVKGKKSKWAISHFLVQALKGTLHEFFHIKEKQGCFWQYFSFGIETNVNWVLCESLLTSNGNLRLMVSWEDLNFFYSLTHNSYSLVQQLLHFLPPFLSQYLLLRIKWRVLQITERINNTKHQTSRLCLVFIVYVCLQTWYRFWFWITFKILEGLLCIL